SCFPGSRPRRGTRPTSSPVGTSRLRSKSEMNATAELAPLRLGAREIDRPRPHRERVIFVPETSAFGGGERVLLALSRFLHLRSIPHRFAWYFRVVNLADHATWPVCEEHLQPPRRPWSKIRALDAYLRQATAEAAGSVLLVGIQAALHAGLCRAK